jgi:hypothetical protein
MLQETFLVLRLMELLLAMVRALTMFSSASLPQKVVMLSSIVGLAVFIPSAVIIISRGVARRLKHQAQRLKIYTTQKN